MTNTLHPEVAPTVVSISLTMDIKKNIQTTTATIRSIAMVLITCRRCQMQSRRTDKTIMRAKKMAAALRHAASIYNSASLELVYKFESSFQSQSNFRVSSSAAFQNI